MSDCFSFENSRSWLFSNHTFGHKFIQCHHSKIISILNITTECFKNNNTSSQIKHITLQKRIALFSDNGDDLCYIYQESTFSYGCVMSRALHSGLNSNIFFKFLHNFAESWSYHKVLLEGMFIARDTDETTFYLNFCMFLFDAVIWIKLTPSRNTHVSGSLFCNSSISANINWAPASIILLNTSNKPY